MLVASMKYDELIAATLLRSQGKLEALLLSRCQSAGLPCPEAQVVLPGRKFAWDFGWQNNHRTWIWSTPKPADSWVLIDVQGAVFSRGKSGHNSGGGIARDAEKAAVAQLAGHVAFACTEAQIRDGKAVAWLCQALGVEAA